MVEGGEPCKARHFLRRQGAKLRHQGKEGCRRDRTDAGGATQQGRPRAHIGVSADQPVDPGLDIGNLGVEHADDLIDRGFDDLVGNPFQAGAFDLAQVDQLVAALVQQAEAFAPRTGRRIRRRREAAAEIRQHAGVERIGLGLAPGQLGEPPGPCGVEPVAGKAGRGKPVGEGPIIGACRFIDNEDIPARQSCQPGDDRLLAVGDPLCPVGRWVENVEMGLGNVASDIARVYSHVAYPCAARSASTASCNCSGW